MHEPMQGVVVTEKKMQTECLFHHKCFSDKGLKCSVSGADLFLYLENPFSIYLKTRGATTGAVSRETKGNAALCWRWWWWSNSVSLKSSGLRGRITTPSEMQCILHAAAWNDLNNRRGSRVTHLE